MPALSAHYTRFAVVAGILAAAAGCKKKDEYASRPPDAYASPAAPSASAASAPVTVEVLAVDAKEPTITVTEAIPGSSTADEAEAGTARGTAGAIADRHTLPVDASASAELSKLEPGQRIDIVCAEVPPANGIGATDTTSPPPDTLAGCTRVAAIMTSAAGSSRGR
jgi:hypothetical protein